MRNIVRLGVPTAVAVIVLVIGTSTTADADLEPRTLPESAPPPGSLVLVDNPLIVHSRPLMVESWSRTDDGATILVHFTSPAPACSGVHANTQESADAVTVDLRGGWLPEAVDRVCPMIVVRGTLGLPLKDPLGNRHVLSY